jgi:hypothetical protein
MDLSELEQRLRDFGEDCEGDDGAWQFEFEGIKMACLADLRFDRMRVLAPIIETGELADGQSEAMLEANFHTALDARYAVSSGVVYAAFLHPMSTLIDRDLESALQQLASLVETFGTTYSGGTLVFGGAGGSDAPN